MSCHGALEPVKMCDSGFMPGSPSIVPSVTEVILPLSAAASEEPHSLQKHHPAPDDTSYTFRRSSPETHLKSPGLKFA